MEQRPMGQSSRATASVAGVCGGQVVMPSGVIPRGCVHFDDHGTITDVDVRVDGEASACGGEAGACGPNHLDAAGSWILPGFVDQHVHGGGGGDFGAPDGAGHIDALRFHARHGTTSLVATTASATRDTLATLVAALTETRTAQPDDGAALLGMHLEGPWISPDQRGAHDLADLRDPDLDELRELAETAAGGIELLTVAPELPGALAFIQSAVDMGIAINVGHTTATHAQVVEAVAAGATGITHTFNAMRGLHHREPGTVGAAMTLPHLWCEAIMDGHHVVAEALQVLHATVGDDRLVLMTDAVAPAGLAPGRHMFQSREVDVADGIVRLAGSDTISGSVLTMDVALRNCITMLGVDVATASAMASGNPARRLGRASQLGELRSGLQADVVMLDADLQVVATLVGGRMVHES